MDKRQATAWVGLNVPFRPLTDPVLDDLGLGNGAHLLKEFLQLASTEAGCKLLDKDSAAIPLIFSKLRCGLTLGLFVTLFLPTEAMVTRVAVGALMLTAIA